MGSDKKQFSIKSIPLLKRCLSYFSPYKGRIALALISMAIVAGASTFSAYLSQPAWDEIFDKHDQTALVIYPLLFVLTFLGKGLFRYLQNYLMRMCGLKVLERLRNELHEKILRLPMGYFDDTQVGMLQSRIIMDVNMIRNSLPAIVMLIRSCLEVVGYMGVAIYMNPKLASMAIFIFPLAVYPIIFFGKKLRKIGRKNQSKISDISVILNEVFNGARVVKAFANERGENDRFAKENERLVSIAEKEVIFSELSSPIMDFIGAMGIAVVMWYCGGQVMAGDVSQGQFIAFVVAAGLIYAPIKKFNSNNMEIQRALAGAERVFEILDSPDIVEEQGGDIRFEPPFSELKLEHVSFSYPGCQRPALADVSLTVKAGQRIALVGPSGSGKTTLVNLIPRFYLPQEGQIHLNGLPLEDYTLDSLRRNVGIVSQDAFLFDTTVAANIAYGQGATDQERVESCARTAYAHEFVTEMPKGYDTVLGERGVKMSGGQKQRLTIARALFKNPPLLILDEATSALDTEAERKVQAALENLMQNRTSVVIAHRLSTVISADLIVVMQNGRIVNTGTHAELLAKCELYARLHAMQFQDEPQAAGPAC
ncbi:ABC transporter ATP-binding protein [Desulfovibrio ferrophilus]|uniref:ABC transporter related protein n=1 Tax=Desulfovibrio ferrophilus TaxID=241368 RepID=A0A2Z6AWW7_9BACT|nr:ABC transporter transmembrane domain-containing protein [Desulfovibrio ferrophilus]BBD07693.1 ABC transporter related protein [Desulfovibrio ferrophilus]